MDRLIFAMGLVGATVILIPTDQSVEQRPYDWHGAYLVSSASSHLTEDDVSQSELHLTPGSQQPVLAPIELQPTGPQSEALSNAFSTTMHNLTSQMLELTPHAQNEVIWLVTALKAKHGEAITAPTSAELSDHLHLLAQSIGELSDEDRKVVVDMAASLASD